MSGLLAKLFRALVLHQDFERAIGPESLYSEAGPSGVAATLRSSAWPGGPSLPVWILPRPVLAPVLTATTGALLVQLRKVIAF